jgi:hypothetical protein
VKLLLAFGVFAAATSTARRASGFELDGHFIIEAVAYQRLLGIAQVPDTDVSGRELLAALIAAGVLVEPPCFDLDHPRASCTEQARRDRPLTFWPRLGAGAADIIVDRQLSARGQCQHFMAETDDGLSAPDPRSGVPVDMATTAYRRCVAILGAAYDGILRDPRLAQERLVGMYALMHAVQDAFSAAHAARDEQGRILHLMSWTLIDWPTYFARGRGSFPAATHHAITDRRDGDFVRGDGVAADGARCADLHNPYAVPESCLTARARAAADAIVDLLALTYRLRARAAAAGRQASLASPEDLAAWHGYVGKHLASAAVPAETPPLAARIGRPRPDTFIGVQAVLSRDGWGGGLWGGRLFFGPALPFALSLNAGAGFDRRGQGTGVVAATGIGIYLPLIRRFAMGVSPAGVALACDAHLESCATALFATLGELLIPLPHSTWLGVQGPRWSWNERTVSGPVVALALGWSHEQAPPGAAFGAGAVSRWNPPRPDEVAAYRSAVTSWLFFFTATAASTSENRWVGGGLELRRDRDRWNRRAGWAPALSLAVTDGLTFGSRGLNVAVAPILRFYLLSDRLWVGGTPAAFRAGKLNGQTIGADVAAVLAVGLIVGRIEATVESPALSYVSRDRWNALPVPLRLGLLWD